MFSKGFLDYAVYFFVLRRPLKKFAYYKCHMIVLGMYKNNKSLR